VGSWRSQPIIHEVNTWVWLDELTRACGQHVDLHNVPETAWDDIVVAGIDAVWLMGVWQRSPRGAAIALDHPGVAADHHAALPDFAPGDVVGSPYCIRSYTVDARLGGDAGLAAAREALARRGARLIVDYVPNHVAHDHPWVSENPGLFVQGTAAEAMERPGEFVEIAGNVIALGRDPFFDPWTDVVQLNAFSPQVRERTEQTLLHIAARADGVRCDMAMLMLNDVFWSTWGDRAGSLPEQEFWPPIIERLKAEHPEFLFLAEVYWGREGQLLWQGFDYCYDKQLHDQLAHPDAETVRAHLGADPAYQRHLVRFLENHDEPRVAATLPPSAWEAAAVIVTTLPGAVLLYEGQFDGRTERPPVALGRRPHEPENAELRRFYLRLLDHLARSSVRHGRWELAGVTGWPDNDTARNLLAWSWQADARLHIVVVNLSDRPAQGRVAVRDLPPAEVVVLDDLLHDQRYERDAGELLQEGLFVSLDAFGFHLFATGDVPAETGYPSGAAG
jgi:glycosidase